MMLNWYKDRKLPGELQIDSGRRATDLPFYVGLHLGWLEKVPVESLAFRLAYFRLYEVKKVLEKIYEKNR